MIILEKLEIYKRYDGDIDGWIRVGDKKEKEIMNDKDWFEIQDLLQKLTLLKSGFVSEEFSQSIKATLEKLTDSKETANKLMDFV